MDNIDYENDWAGEVRVDPIGGNHMVLRGISGSMENGTFGYSVLINDIMGGHSQWLAAFEWIEWAKA